MHFNWNRLLGRALVSSVVACAATSALYAIPGGPCDQKKPDVCCAEPKPGPFAFAYPMDMNLTCPRDFFVHVDGLAFQAKQDGLEFAIIDSTTMTNASAITHGRVDGFSNDHKDWDYNPGVRFGVGFFLDHDAWAIDFNWTWLNITNYKTANSSVSGGVVVPLWLIGSGLGPSSENSAIGGRSSGVWDASYNVLDARLAKPYHVSRYLVFTPHMGVRAGWIDQHCAFDYGGTNGGAATRTIATNDNNFWGFGTRFGLDTDWMLGKGWSLFGNVSFSMLFGQFEVDQNMTMASGLTTNASEGYDLNFDFYQNVPNLEMAMGLAWGKYFNKSRYHVALKAAYEFVDWFDQLYIRKFYSGAPGYANDVVSRGNFTMNGFSLRLQFDI